MCFFYLICQSFWLYVNCTFFASANITSLWQKRCNFQIYCVITVGVCNYRSLEWIGLFCHINGWTRRGDRGQSIVWIIWKILFFTIHRMWKRSSDILHWTEELFTKKRIDTVANGLHWKYIVIFMVLLQKRRKQALKCEKIKIHSMIQL